MEGPLLATWRHRSADPSIADLREHWALLPAVSAVPGDSTGSPLGHRE